MSDVQAAKDLCGMPGSSASLSMTAPATKLPDITLVTLTRFMKEASPFGLGHVSAHDSSEYLLNRSFIGEVTRAKTRHKAPP